MENFNESSAQDSIINLKNVSLLITYGLLLTVIFTLVKAHLYFYLLLHVPIFQYLEVSEIPLLSAGSGIIWVIYLGCVFGVNNIKQNPDFSKAQQFACGIALYVLMIVYVVLSYYNEPVIHKVFLLPFHGWRYLYFVFLFVFIYLFMYPGNEIPAFLKKNIFILHIVMTIWYGLYEGYANYELVTGNEYTNQINLKLSNGNIIRTDNNIVSAGRTKNFWFLYNRQTKTVRAFKTDSITVVDFNTKNGR